MKKELTPLTRAFRAAGIRQPIINKFIVNGIETFEQLEGCRPDLRWKQVGKSTVEEVQQARVAVLQGRALQTIDAKPAEAPAPLTIESLWTDRSDKYRLYFEGYLALGTYEAVGKTVGLTRERVRQVLNEGREGLKESAEQLIQAQVSRIEAGELAALPSDKTRFANAWFIAGRTVKELAYLGERVAKATVVEARCKALRERLGAPYPAVQGIDPTALGLTVDDVLHVMAKKPSQRIPGIRLHRSGRVSRTPWSRSDWMRWNMFADGQERPQSTWEAMLPQEHVFKPSHKNRSSIWMRWADNDPQVAGRNRKKGRRSAAQGKEDRIQYALHATASDLDLLELDLTDSSETLQAAYAEWQRQTPDSSAPRPTIVQSLPPVQPSPSPAPVEAGSFSEGTRLRREVTVIKRNSTIVHRAKRRLWNQDALVCECCGLNPRREYGHSFEESKRVIEAHHIRPISATEEERQVSGADLAMLCGTCHELVHIELDRGTNPEAAIEAVQAAVFRTTPRAA